VSQSDHGIEPNTRRNSRVGVIDCPQTGRQSAKCQRMRHFSNSGFGGHKSYVFGQARASAPCSAVPLLIPVSSVISRHEWPSERKCATLEASTIFGRASRFPRLLARASPALILKALMLKHEVRTI
jgi:hypothetical protein